LAGLDAEGVVLTDDFNAGLDSCDVLIDFSAPKAAIDAALILSGRPQCRRYWLRSAARRRRDWTA